MASVGDALASHVANPIKTRFFEFLLWAMSPFPLFFAAAGLREAQRLRPSLFLTLLAWVGPALRVLLHEYHHAELPAAGGAAADAGGRDRHVVVRRVGDAAPGGVARRSCSRSASPTCSSACPSSIPAAPAASSRTPRSPPTTGASGPGRCCTSRTCAIALAPGRLLHTRFRASAAGELSYAAMFDTLSAGGRRGRRVAIVSAAGYGNTMHFFAHLAGACRRPTAPCLTWDSACTMELGGARLGVVGLASLRGNSERVDVQAGRRGLGRRARQHRWRRAGSAPARSPATHPTTDVDHGTEADALPGPGAHLMTASGTMLSVVMPAYNEEDGHRSRGCRRTRARARHGRDGRNWSS